MKGEDNECDDSVRVLRAKARLAFTKCTLEDKIDLAREATNEPGLDPTLRKDLCCKIALLKAEQECSAATSKTRRVLEAKSACFTWYSDTLHLEVPPAQPPLESLEAAVRWVQSLQAVQLLWQDFLLHLEKAASEKLCADQWSAALEICTDTFLNSDKRSVKCHLHFGVSKKQKMVFWTFASAGLVYRGLKPHCSSDKIPGVIIANEKAAAGGRGPRYSGSNNAVHFYLQCESKKGSVFRSGTKMPFRQYPVKAAWLSHWLQVAFRVSVLFRSKL